MKQPQVCRQRRNFSLDGQTSFLFVLSFWNRSVLLRYMNCNRDNYLCLNCKITLNRYTNKTAWHFIVDRGILAVYIFQYRYKICKKLWMWVEKSRRPDLFFQGAITDFHLISNNATQTFRDTMVMWGIMPDELSENNGRRGGLGCPLPTFVESNIFW